MENSITYWQKMLMQEIEEKELSSKQQKIAKLDPPIDKLDAGDFKALRAGEKIDEEGQDHEVSMANSSLESILKAAMDLKSKLGHEEKDIPAWIQDHITNAANYINQAADNYHEYSQEEIEDSDLDEMADTDEDFKSILSKYRTGSEQEQAIISSALGLGPKSSLDKVYKELRDAGKEDIEHIKSELSGKNLDECGECDRQDASIPSLEDLMEQILNEKKPSTGLTKKQKSTIAKKAKAGKDIGKKGKGFEKIAAKAAKEYGSKERGQKVAAAAMWKSAAKKAK